MVWASLLQTYYCLSVGFFARILTQPCYCFDDKLLTVIKLNLHRCKGFSKVFKYKKGQHFCQPFDNSAFLFAFNVSLDVSYNLHIYYNMLPSAIIKCDLFVTNYRSNYKRFLKLPVLNFLSTIKKEVPKWNPLVINEIL